MAEGCAMSFKDILVALDGLKQTQRRIELAATLAERFEAHLVGLHTALAVAQERPRGYFDHFDRSLLEPLYGDFAERMHAEADWTRGIFEDVARRRGISAEWRLASGYPSQTAALHGRYADLIVLGKPEPDDTQAALLRPLPEEVAMAAGRP